MKSNALLKWLVIPVVLALLFAGIKLFSGAPDHAAAPTGSAPALTAVEMKALGVEGDTPRDTVATLVAQVKQLRAEVQGSRGDNQQQQAENARLRARENTIDQRIQAALDDERTRLQQQREQLVSDQHQTQGLLADLQRRLDALSARKGSAANLPVGLGLGEGDDNPLGESAVERLQWIEPAGTPTHTNAARTDASFSTSFGPAQKTLSAATDAVADAGRQVMDTSVSRVYTVPRNATLMGSVAMTALIGRVPIDGTVNDPYPFKVLIGPDNLTANGIDLPDVAGAVVSGTASGDWTLSCVRGHIRSVTFVFRDGTIRTVPQDSGSTATGNSSSGAGQGGLGWISDPFGIPCVSGERRSNAQQYLGSQALITAAGAGAASMITSDNGSVAVVANRNGSLGTVGISGNEAMGRILAGGVRDMADWVNKLYGQAFAAVYVKPGAEVAVHLEQPLDIDYDAKGRRVNHRLGEAHAPDLD